MDAAPLDGRDDPGDGDGHERSWRAAAGLIAVLAVLAAVVWLLSLTSDGAGRLDGRDADPVDEERFIAPTTTSPPPTAEASTEAVPADGEPEGAAPAEPFSQLKGRLMYLSSRHVILLDLATGAVQRVLIEPFGSVIELADLELLTDSKRTVGLSLADDPPSAVLVASGAELAPSIQPLIDCWVISRPDGPGGTIRINAWQDYGVLAGSPSPVRAVSDPCVARTVGHSRIRVPFEGSGWALP